MLRTRLMQRRQDPPDAIARRLEWAVRELGVAGEFEYAIINDRLEQAVESLYAICKAEHHRSRRMKPVLDLIRSEFLEAVKKDRDQ